MATAPKKIKSLKPGEKVELKVSKAKVKVAQLKKIKAELERLNALNINLKYKAPSSKSVQKQIASLMTSIQQEIANQRKLIIELELAPLLPYIKVIQKECSQAIAAYKQTGIVLLRGSGKAPAIFKGKSWDQRRVRNSTKIGQDLFDAALKKLGITALRSNSIFTSSAVEQVSIYGKIYIIFPKNGFQFSWTKFDPDVVIDDPREIWNDKIIEKLENDINRYFTKTNQLDGYYYDVAEELDHQGIEKFVNELKSKGYPKADLVTPENLVDAKYVKSEYGPDNKNFVAAIQSGGEVLISGEYYAFLLSSFKGIVNLLGINASNISN
jgi:hypothetical protein